VFASEVQAEAGRVAGRLELWQQPTDLALYSGWSPPPPPEGLYGLVAAKMMLLRLAGTAPGARGETWGPWDPPDGGGEDHEDCEGLSDEEHEDLSGLGFRSWTRPSDASCYWRVVWPVYRSLGRLP
jgi:hypothetical protein